MTTRRTVFVVEDDRKIAAVLIDYLQAVGYATRSFPDGRSVIASVRQEAPAAIILDRTLPTGDGLDLCASLREFSAVPVLMLTARVELSDRLDGLGRGADDYVTKPFSASEVVARIDSLIRRAEGRVTNDPSAKTFAVDDAGQRIAWRGNWLDLSASEFGILAQLMKHPGRVFSRDQLLDLLGERAQASGDRAIDSHIKNVRRKIDMVDPGAKCISSVYGSGYRFDLP